MIEDLYSENITVSIPTAEEAIKSTYDKLSYDGVNFLIDYRAETLEKVQNPGDPMTEQQAIDIDEILSDVKSNFSPKIGGDWKTARQMVNAKAVTPSFTQAIKDDLISRFDTYISENY